MRPDRQFTPESVGAPSEAEKLQEVFMKLPADQQQVIKNAAETSARKTEAVKEEAHRAELIKRGKNPDQKNLNF